MSVAKRLIEDELDRTEIEARIAETAHSAWEEARDLAEDTGSVSERMAAAIRDTHTGGHGVKPELKRDQWDTVVVDDERFLVNNDARCHVKWQNQATDESGLPVAAVPTKEQIAMDHITQTGTLSKARPPILMSYVEIGKEGDKYVTKDSGQRDLFESGCQRDTNEGKGRQSLMPSRPSRRIAQLYERGAKKYNDHNWRKGMPFSRVIDSLIRHIEQYRDANVLPDDKEDHLAAVAWNAITLMEYEEAIKAGQLPATLDDRFRYPPLK